MSEVTVRAAHPDEWEAAGRITVAAYFADKHIDSRTGGYADDLGDAATRAVEAELLVAVAGREVVGTVTVVHPGTRWSEVSREGELEFRMLAVAPAARGRGVGEQLLQAVIDHAKAAGVRRLVLSSSEHMTTAHRLYRRHGFERLPERDWQTVSGLTLHAFVLNLGHSNE